MKTKTREFTTRRLKGANRPVEGQASHFEMVSDLDPRFNVMNFWNNILNVHWIRGFKGNLHCGTSGMM